MSDYVPEFNKAFGKDFDILRITDEYAKSFLGIHFTSVKNPDATGTININIEGDPHSMARNQLLIDGYMVEHPKGSGYFYLTGEGRYFISKGGYAGRAAEQEELNKLNKNQLQSIIDTNTSVRKTNLIQKLSAISTFIIIATALLIQFMSYKKEKTEMQPITDSLLKVKMRLDKLETKSLPLSSIKDSLTK
jgi:hypothetical protein